MVFGDPYDLQEGQYEPERIFIGDDVMIGPADIQALPRDRRKNRVVIPDRELKGNLCDIYAGGQHWLIPKVADPTAYIVPYFMVDMKTLFKRPSELMNKRMSLVQSDYQLARSGDLYVMSSLGFVHVEIDDNHFPQPGRSQWNIGKLVIGSSMGRPYFRHVALFGGWPWIQTDLEIQNMLIACVDHISDHQASMSHHSRESVSTGWSYSTHHFGFQLGIICDLCLEYQAECQDRWTKMTEQMFPDDESEYDEICGGPNISFRDEIGKGWESE